MKFYVEFPNGVFECEADRFKLINGDVCFVDPEDKPLAVVRGFVFVGERNPNEFFKQVE